MECKLHLYFFLYCPNRPIRSSKSIGRGQFSIITWPKDSWLWTSQKWLLNIFCLCFILFTLNIFMKPTLWQGSNLQYSESSIVMHCAVGCWTKLQVCTLLHVEKTKNFWWKSHPIREFTFRESSTFNQWSRMATKVQMSLSHGRSLETFEHPPQTKPWLQSELQGRQPRSPAEPNSNL